MENTSVYTPDAEEAIEKFRNGEMPMVMFFANGVPCCAFLDRIGLWRIPFLDKESGRKLADIWLTRNATAQVCWLCDNRDDYQCAVVIREARIAIWTES